MKDIRIALAGNPNCGKTTLFNALTGANQYVGNWPGVTVEHKEGKLRNFDGVSVVDLPGIYSLSPYTLEEVIARDYLVNERPEVILNIVDGTNIERNLYLTLQLAELGIPMVIAVNMMDIVRKNGDKIDIEKLSNELGIPVVEISALKSEGIHQAAQVALTTAREGKCPPVYMFSGVVEHALAHIEEATVHHLPDAKQRWYAVKLFERDNKVLEELEISPEVSGHIENDIAFVEKRFDDDAEGIIINERYLYITELVKACCVKKSAGKRKISDKIDLILTNRVLAIPIFIAVMFLVYTISIGTIGDWTVGFMNDTLFGEWITPAVERFLTAINCEGWLIGLVCQGIVGGVGAVLGFVPQMLILFLLLSLLEDCGYMSRIAFIMDKIFRKFGLSGKSFIPMLVSSGCGVPGVMASRTIEQERDRRMTVMTTCFIPCGAKMPIVGLIAGALFGGAPWVATSAYFIGVAAVVVSGIILKKTKAFSGKAAPFVMELPAYHMPVASNVLRTTWERGWDFIKRAGTVILAASVIIWTLNSLSFTGGLHYITEGEGSVSILQLIGGALAYIFRPLGFGSWQAAVATILGLVAKEEVVGVLGSLSSMAGGEESTMYLFIGHEFFNSNPWSAYSFMIFNLLCAPCFAAMGAIKREMNSAKWTFAALGYMTVFAYAVSFMTYNLGMLFTRGVFGVNTILAFAVLGYGVYLITRKGVRG